MPSRETQSWRARWDAFLSDATGIPVEVSANHVAEPASSEVLEQIEEVVRLPLPPKFRRFLEADCGGVDIWWCFKDDAEIRLEGARESIVAGSFEFNASSILSENPHYEPEFTPTEYDSEYRSRNTLAFASTPNGDQFSVILDGPTRDSIIYLSHDIDDIHRYLVATDMESFFWNYARLGFAGPEFWIWEQFTNSRSSPIDADCKEARSFLQCLKMGIRSPEAEEASRKAAEAARLVRFKHFIEPEARRLLEKKRARAKDFLILVEDYQDLLTGAMKARYEYLLKDRRAS